jgi:hypothetical protein
MRTDESISSIFVEITSHKSKKSFKLIQVKYAILIKPLILKQKIIKKINELTLIPPLSKFGIEYQFKVYKDENYFKNTLPKGRLYAYSSRNTHSFAKVLKTNNSNGKYPIVSKIRVNIDEKNFEN